MPAAANLHAIRWSISYLADLLSRRPDDPRADVWRRAIASQQLLLDTYETIYAATGQTVKWRN
jgi:hypothetical protein